MLYTKELAIAFKKAFDNVEVKIEEDTERMFDVIATTEDTDRDNEVIKINAWDTTNREKNSVVLANHNYTIESIIWKGLKFYTSDWIKRLKGVFSKTNPLWVLAKNLYQEWMLKSVSVGFIPLKRNQNDYKIIEKAELLEVSFVAVPCNPNAVSLDWKLYTEAVQKWFLKEIELKSLSQEDTIESKLEDLIMKENYIDETVSQYIRIVWIYNTEFVYNHFSYADNDRFDKYYRRWYENRDWEISLTWNSIEVEPQTEWVDKKNLDELRSDVKEMKSLLKLFADDKAKREQIEKEVEDAKGQKLLLQEINKASAIALQKIKLL